MTKTLIPAAGYLRMSSDKQDKSIDGQRGELLTYAAQHGYKIVVWYADEGISGWKNKQRIGFQKLIADAPDGEFRAVLCWDQSRFSRFDPMEANYYWHILRQSKVSIETVKEGRLDFETLGGWLSASVQQHGKAEYIKSLATDVARGMRKRYEEGRWLNTPPFGYVLRDGRLALGDADKIALVRKVFEMHAEGHGWRTIAAELNAGPLRSPRGGTWCVSQVEQMLKRRSYIGHTVIGEHAEGKFARVFDGIKVIENTHPPIVDRALWDRAQATLEGRGGRTYPGRKPNIGGQLSGLLRCGCCGAPMHHGSYKGRYVCRGYADGTCTYNTVKAGPMVALVAEKIVSSVLLGSLDKLTAAIEKVLKRRSGKQREIDVAGLKRQIAEIDRKLGSAAERLLDVEADLVATVHEAMRGLRDRKESLVATLAAASVPKKKPLTAEQAAKQLWKLPESLVTLDAATARRQLAGIIDRIEIAFTPRPMAASPDKTRWVVTSGTMFFCSERPNSDCRTGTFLTSLLPKQIPLKREDFERLAVV